MLWKGAEIMKKNDDNGRDVDDLIFQGEPWHPSDR